MPGEQAVVFSVTELLLRLMGEADICYTLQDDSYWEDVVGATVMCSLESLEEKEDKAGEEAEEAEDAEEDAEGNGEENGEEDESAAGGGKPKYSEEFKSLVVGLP